MRFNKKIFCDSILVRYLGIFFVLKQTQRSREMDNLQEAIDFIAAQFAFDQESYSTLEKSTTEKEKLLFVVNHSLLHMVKSQGRLAAAIEACDHGKELNNFTVHKLTAEMFIHTLRLAEGAGMTAQELLDWVPTLIKAKGDGKQKSDWFQKLLPPKQPLK